MYLDCKFRFGCKIRSVLFSKKDNTLSYGKIKSDYMGKDSNERMKNMGTKSSGNYKHREVGPRVQKIQEILSKGWQISR